VGDTPFASAWAIGRCGRTVHHAFDIALAWCDNNINTVQAVMETSKRVGIVQRVQVG
jgi:hypothetical protein